MAKKDFIISWFADSPGLDKVLAELQTPFVLFQPAVANRAYKDFVVSKAGNSVLGLWNLAKKPGDELGRVAVLGFSEGGQGVRATLETTDASTIDAVIVADGVHTQKIAGALEMTRLAPFISFGRLCVASPVSQDPDTKLMVITHSSIGPASLPAGIGSTTETGEVIWTESIKAATEIENQDCGFPCPPALHQSALVQIHWPNLEYPIGAKVGGGTITEGGWTTVRPSAAETGFIPSASFTWSGFDDGWTIRRMANNLCVFGWSYPTQNKTKDPTGNRDHVFQATMVLPAIAREYLVSRWNAECGPVAGLGQGEEPAMACVMSGKGYADQPQKPLVSPFAAGIPIPKLAPTPCPQPAPGQFIIGRPGDPCWSGAPTSSPGSGSASSALGKALAVIAGGLAGFYGLKFLRKRRV